MRQRSLYTGAALALGLGALTGALFGKQCRTTFERASSDNVTVSRPASLDDIVHPSYPIRALAPVAIDALDILEPATSTISIPEYTAASSTQTEEDDPFFSDYVEPQPIPKPHYFNDDLPQSWVYLQGGWQDLKLKDSTVSTEKIKTLLENLQGSERDELLRDISDYCTHAESRIYAAIELTQAVIDMKIDKDAKVDAYREHIARAMGNSLSDSINNSSRTGNDFSYECETLWERMAPDARAVAPASHMILRNMDPRSVQLLSRTVIDSYDQHIKIFSIVPTSGSTSALDDKVEEYQRKKQNVLDNLRAVELLK